eukprot:CAMPEP_0198336994 /NCGR_PEP_ID=MMETSP1450-20131203/23970_1 /TAXON_ID=753684 ORGANISM="Madagascaria erythrocladiodes, Strain CCMP3234" /NCGR_SAMPLE_ID=MMETSP1450 /ASSEMBLY_ACC=CAM_ASM_001115 /LENGTH=41 /DNA_ID= /DNA_START= /DNA_END= /DNA_ORIENTATION=
MVAAAAAAAATAVRASTASKAELVATPVGMHCEADSECDVL